MEHIRYIDWEDNALPKHVSWSDYIPPPEYMVKPDLSWEGTCIGHAYAECLTSRRRIVAEENGNPIDQTRDVSIPLLVEELVRSECITRDGGKPSDVSEYICRNGAPLVRQNERASISGFHIAQLTNLQDFSIFDLPDELNTTELSRVIMQRFCLLSEIDDNGPVIGLFKAGHHWPEANGEIYYDDCSYLISRSDEDGEIYYDDCSYLISRSDEDVRSLGPHAALVYGFDNSANDAFDVQLFLQDSMGPTAHTDGRARMNISSLRGYIVPYVNNDQRFM